jgi:DNA polymerase-3 subunit epsilon
MVIDRGRNFEERSVILVENGKYSGYGYIDNSSQFGSPDEIRDIIKQTPWYPDANDLIRSFIRLNSGKVKVVPL